MQPSPSPPATQVQAPHPSSTAWEGGPRDELPEGEGQDSPLQSAPAASLAHVKCLPSRKSLCNGLDVPWDKHVNKTDEEMTGPAGARSAPSPAAQMHWACMALGAWAAGATPCSEGRALGSVTAAPSSRPLAPLHPQQPWSGCLCAGSAWGNLGVRLVRRPWTGHQETKQAGVGSAEWRLVGSWTACFQGLLCHPSAGWLGPVTSGSRPHVFFLQKGDRHWEL